MTAPLDEAQLAALEELEAEARDLLPVGEDAADIEAYESAIRNAAPALFAGLRAAWAERDALKAALGDAGAKLQDGVELIKKAWAERDAARAELRTTRYPTPSLYNAALLVAEQVTEGRAPTGPALTALVDAVLAERERAKGETP